MNKPILLLLLILCSYRLYASAYYERDTVRPVVSADYLLLISQNDSIIRSHQTDSSTNIGYSSIYVRKGATLSGIRNIKMTGNSLVLYKAHRTLLNIGGNYTATTELKKTNRMPATQNSYVQGSNTNGVLTWRGAETNELFSFGPSVDQLEFDGSAYPYDVNGKLVPKGSGNGKPAIAYTSPVLRNGFLFSHALSVTAALRRDGITKFNILLKASKANERTLFIGNNNQVRNFSLQSNANFKLLDISGGYGVSASHFSNTNRNGFLNRVYMSSLLTPVSFANTQGVLLPNGLQKSYNIDADNPYFLLATANAYGLLKNNANLTLQTKGKLGLKLAQSIEDSRESGDENFAPGTAFFFSGMHTERIKRDKLYHLATEAAYSFRYGKYGRVSSYAIQRYIITDAVTDISYSNAGQYRFQRTSHELISQYQTTWSPWNANFTANLDLSNKIYLSNTLSGSNFFSPGIEANIHTNRFMNVPSLNVRFAAALENFCSEPPLNRSMSSTSLLQLNTSDALKYFPMKEVSIDKSATAIRNNEFNVKLEASYSYQYSMLTRFFIRNTSNDVFPLMVNNEIHLRNLADHRYSGFEIQFNRYSRYNSKKLSMSNSISLLTYNSKVTKVYGKEQVVPVAGFSNVYKAVVPGESLGVIVGSKFLKDADGRKIIGNDGFPLVDPIPGVIGDPTPDFNMKSSNTISWKNVHLSADIEWRKGGDVWNGTQAVLDYYGRSSASAALRNTVNYVFGGVHQDGSSNTLPVSFYDAKKPFADNRWIRYGFAGIAEEYIEKADQVRINNLSLSYKLKLKKYANQLSVTAYAANIIVWSAYTGVDASQLLYDMPGTSGLDFFNLPSMTSYGLNISLQF